MSQDTHCTHRHRSPRIAWAALAGLFLVLAVAAFADPSQIEAAGPLLQTIAYALTGVVLIDMGGCEMPEVVRDVLAARR